MGYCACAACFEAAPVASKIGPKAATPCHDDMFRDNPVDPRQFQASLKLCAPDIRYQKLKHGEPLVLSL